MCLLLWRRVIQYCARPLAMFSLKNRLHATAPPHLYPYPFQGARSNQRSAALHLGVSVAIGTVADQIATFQRLYQADSPFNLNAPNPNYAGSLLAQGVGITSFFGMYDPNFRTPRSIEMNVGVQREIRPSMIFSADFLRNVQTHYFLSIDVDVDVHVYYVLHV
jgi:hypothetical protein